MIAGAFLLICAVLWAVMIAVSVAVEAPEVDDPFMIGIFIGLTILPMTVGGLALVNQVC
jgi:hypothetical protein